MMLQQPTMVWYHSHGSPDGTYKSEPRTAIVTGVVPEKDGSPGDGSRLMLCVITPQGIFFDQDCQVAAEPTPGRWTMPHA